MKRILSLVVIAVMAVLIPYGAWQAYQNYLISPKPISQEEILANKQKELEKAISKAKAGDAEAQYQMGLKYYNGRVNVDVDYKKAFEWYQKAAEQGHVKAQNNLGLMYQTGQGTSKDIQKAIYWYEKAVEQGNVKAHVNLGHVFYFARGSVEQNYERAHELYQRASEEGDVEAKYKLGVMYYYGRGVDIDYQKALEYFSYAIDKNHSVAYQALAVMFRDGQGVERDLPHAGSLYQKAADLGYEDANTYLEDQRKLCLEEQATSSKRDQVNACLIVAGTKTEPEALRNLVLFYVKGQGVHEDDVEAYAWGSAYLSLFTKEERMESDQKKGLIISLMALLSEMDKSTQEEAIKKAQLYIKNFGQEQ